MAQQHRPDTPTDRILLVEDNYLVGIGLKSVLEDRGWAVLGPVATLGEALRVIEASRFVGAVLDINIVGGTSAAIARLLRERGCPFFFVTGYASPMRLPDDLAAVTRLTKPIDDEVLGVTVATEFRRD